MLSDDVAAQLAALAADRGRRRLLIAPSMRETHALVDRWAAASRGPTVVAPQWGFPVASLLREMERAPVPERILVFSDQLTSPIDAPLLVSLGTEGTFLSNLEVLLAQAFDYEVAVWTQCGFARVEKRVPRSVLVALMTYLSACGELGDEWLARDAQVGRCPSTRAAETRHRVRLLQSALMAAAVAGRIRNDECRAALTRLDHLHRSLVLRRVS